MPYSKHTLPGTRKPRKLKRDYYSCIKYKLPKNITYKWIADNLHKINHFKKEISKRKLWLEVQAVAFYEKLKEEQKPKYQTPITAFAETKLSVQLFALINRFRFKISFALMILWMSFITEITFSQVTDKTIYLSQTSNKANENNHANFLIEKADVLDDEYVIKGRLVNRLGEPLANRKVEIFDNDATVKRFSTYTDADGNFETKIVITGIEKIIDNIPKEFSVSNVYPNPTAGKFSSDLNLPNSGNVDVKVFDLNGEKVLDLFSGFLEAGKYKFSGDLSVFASAPYFVNVNVSEKENETKKVMKITDYHLNGLDAPVIKNESRVVNSNEKLNKAAADGYIDNIWFYVDDIARVNIRRIPYALAKNIGTVVGNEGPKVVAPIPDLTLNKGETKVIDLSKHFKNDTGTIYSASTGKVQDDKLTITADASMKSQKITVNAVDVVPDVYSGPLTAKTDFKLKLDFTKLIVGPVYDLWTKYDKRSSAGNLIPGQKKPVNARVFLGSDTTKFADVDSLTGLAVIELGYEKAGKDSIIIIPKDTSFVKYKNNRLSLVGGTHEIKAFNDDTGIPLFKARKEVLDYFVKMAVIPYINNPNLGEYIKTSSRIRNQDIPIKINMNRNKDPAGGMQADSLMAGHHQLIKKINEKIGFDFLAIKEVGENQGATTSVEYDAGSDAFIFDTKIAFDGKNWYTETRNYKIRGPPLNNMMDKKYLSFVSAHEFARVLGNFSLNNADKKDIADIMYMDVISRYDAGYRTYGTDREFMAMAINFLLEMNPKWLDYSK